jgi:2-methylcitrate dehydratase PrpD
VRGLMEHMSIVPNSALNRYLPDGFPAAIEVRRRDGDRRFIEMPFAPGHAQNPMSLDQVARKFRRFTTGSIPDERVEVIAAAIQDLDKMRSVRSLTRLLSQE